MHKYVTTVKPLKHTSFTGDNYYEDDHKTITIHEQGKEPEFTGLMDKNGNWLYRHPTKTKIGFI